jgi:hypothetical protein
MRTYARNREGVVVLDREIHWILALVQEERPVCYGTTREEDN